MAKKTYSTGLVNLESMNAELIKLGLDRPERAARLNQMAIDQLCPIRIVVSGHLS